MKEEPLTYPGWWQSYWKVHKDSGMHVLVNKSEEIIKNDTAMRISGITLPRECYRKGRIPSLSAGYIDGGEKLEKLQTKTLNCCLLTHQPLQKDIC